MYSPNSTRALGPTDAQALVPQTTYTCLVLGTTQRILLKMKVKKGRKLLMNQMLRRKRRRKKTMKLLD